jgi:ABC-type Fe3+/spermidine/putrescine transport system ATPase subunit
MNDGKIEQDAPPGEVIEKPATAFVSNFLGNVNLFHGRVEVEVHDENGRPMPMELDGERSEAVRVIVGDRVYVRPRAGQPAPQSPDRR